MDPVERARAVLRDAEERFPELKKQKPVKAVAKDSTTDRPIGGLYPSGMEDYVGQRQAKRKALVQATSAKIRGVPMAHTLITAGAPGIGKTTLAILLADFMGVSFKFASGKIKMAQARILLSTMHDRDVLIIDEFHQMVAKGNRDAEWLLHYLENGCLVGPMGVEEVPRVTIIGCTTDAGVLQDTIRDRFVQISLVTYTADEAAQIAKRMAAQIFTAPMPQPTPANLAAIARAASHNPRLMRSLLETTRDLALVYEGGNFRSKQRGYDLDETLDLHNLTEDGLNEVAQRYVLVLLQQFQGEAAGESALRDRLQEPSGLRATERLLMEKGYITKTKQGRMLTMPGTIAARRLEGAA